MFDKFLPSYQKQINIRKVAILFCTLYTNTLYTNILYTNTLYTNTLYTNTLYTNTPQFVCFCTCGRSCLASSRGRLDATAAVGYRYKCGGFPSNSTLFAPNIGNIGQILQKLMWGTHTYLRTQKHTQGTRRLQKLCRNEIAFGTTTASLVTSCVKT